MQRWCLLINAIVLPLAVWAALSVALPAQAHLMPAQRGSINLVEGGAFVVLSVPVSALPSVDDDGDHLLSELELARHRGRIESHLVANLSLRDANGPCPLLIVGLSLSPPDETPNGPAEQIVVLARFAVSAPNGTMSVGVNLWGSKAREQGFNIKVTRAPETQLVVLKPDRAQVVLFPGTLAVFADYVRLGAEHILLGFDHLAFLLVVLAAGWTWRQAVLALTGFTLGHCISLIMSIWGGWMISPAVVEPAIAATIVAMAVRDYARRDRPDVFWLRIGLVLCCALIHGLGLGASLAEFGLDSQHKWLSLFGFNLGVEFGQLLVALLVWLVAYVIVHWRGLDAVRHLARAASIAGALLGSAWFVQRIVT